jgi:hypothetical protein
MIFHRAMQLAFIRLRIIRSGRFMPRIAGTACLVAGVSAAVAFPAGSAVAQVSATRTLAYSQTIIVHVSGGPPVVALDFNRAVDTP